MAWRSCGPLRIWWEAENKKRRRSSTSGEARCGKSALFIYHSIVWVENTFSSCHHTGCPAARDLGTSSRRWFRLPRKRREMSCSACTKRPSTSTSSMDSSSSVASQRGWLPSVRSSSSVNPEKAHTVFCG